MSKSYSERMWDMGSADVGFGDWYSGYESACHDCSELAKEADAEIECLRSELAELQAAIREEGTG